MRLKSHEELLSIYRRFSRRQLLEVQAVVTKHRDAPYPNAKAWVERTDGVLKIIWAERLAAMMPEA